MFSEELLLEIKDLFLFWHESGQEFGMPQYSKENCDKAESIILNLISELERLGSDSLEGTRISAFESSVVAMNNLSYLVPGLIETGERESLCDIYDQIARSVGIDPSKCGEGDGIASEWREW